MLCGMLYKFYGAGMEIQIINMLLSQGLSDKMTLQQRLEDVKENSGKYFGEIPGKNSSYQHPGAGAYVMWVIDSRKVSHAE